MKKIWFAVLVLLVSVGLAGCQEADTLSFEVEVIDLNGEVLLNQSIDFTEEATMPIIDMIDQEIGIDYTSYDIGLFVNGVADYYPTEYGVTYNYYYSFLINDEIATVGIDQLELEDGMKLTFKEVTTLDVTDQKVDQLIQSFIDQHLSLYLNDNTFDHYVLAAINQLDLHGYMGPVLLTDLIPNSYLLMERETIANTFKMTIVEKAYQRNLDDTKTALSGFVADNPYDAATLLNALTMTDGSSTQISDLINILTSTPSFMDADYAGMILLALAPYIDNQLTTQTINDMESFIQTVLTENGVESWGNANSSSTATVILGLVAHGINPRSTTYSTNDVDLIEALLTYELDGAYKWLLADEQADMAFSTPQVFSALVAYKIYRDVYGNPAFNLFDF